MNTGLVQYNSTSLTQIAETLKLLLPDSRLHDTLSQLPPLDATNPTATTYFGIQSAIQNTLPILEELTDIAESQDAETIRKEFEKRRTRLGAPPADILKREITVEVLAKSQVRHSILVRLL